MLGDVAFDGRDEFTHAGKGSAANPVGAEVAEEALGHVEPGGAGGREAHVKAPMTLQPADHPRMFVRAVIIGDPVQGLVRRSLPIQLLKEFQPFAVGVAGHASANDGAVQDTERRKQRRRPVALVIVRHLRPPSHAKRRAAGSRPEVKLLLLFGRRGNRRGNSHNVHPILSNARIAYKLY